MKKQLNFHPHDLLEERSISHLMDPYDDAGPGLSREGWILYRYFERIKYAIELSCY